MFHGKIAIIDVSPDEGKYFANNVAKLLGVAPLNTTVGKFGDGETDIDIKDSCRDKDVYIFQSYIPPLGERKYELENAASAALSGGVGERITVVFPYCFGMCGERQTRPRQSVPIEVWARSLYAMDVSNVITIGLHTEVIKTIFRTVGENKGIKVEDLPFEPLAANYIMNSAREQGYRSIVVESPDAGGTKRVEKTIAMTIAASKGRLDVDLALGHKHREKADTVALKRIVGDVEGKPVYMYDDIGRTLGTMVENVRGLKEKGAREAYLIMIHPVLATGYEKSLQALLDDAFVKEIVFGNTIPLKGIAIDHPKVRTIPLELFVSEAIRRMNQDESMSQLHEYETIIRLYEKKQERTPNGHRYVRLKSASRRSLARARKR